MQYWLCKTEPSTFSIEDLKRDKTTLWDSVRNYQARNFLTAMKKGDIVLIYHSSTDAPGIAGIASVAKEAVPDPTQFDQRSDYFDDKATPEKPRWFSPEIRFKEMFREILPLAALRAQKALKNMVLLQRGSRLSVQPMTEEEYKVILDLR